MRPRARGSIAETLLWSLLLGGCGNLTAGGFGDLEVFVASDSVSAVLPQVAPAAASVDPARRTGGERAQLEGTLTMRIRVFAQTRSDAGIEVTDGVREITMPLSGAQPEILGRRELPAGPYSAIRTVFLDVEAMVQGGLIVDGQPVRGPVRVDLGPDFRLVVDSPVDLIVSEDASARIDIDLHASRWLRLLSQDGRVRAEDFAGEVRVRRHP